MGIKTTIKELLNTKGMTTSLPLETELLEELLCKTGIALSDSHKYFLAQSNGCEVFGGYFRLFSMEHILKRNEYSDWKFSWGKDLSNYYCFGETAWGDQYVYKKNEINEGLSNVYILDAYTMEEDFLSSSFDLFFVEEFLRNALHPYDEMIIEARKK